MTFHDANHRFLLVTANNAAWALGKVWAFLGLWSSFLFASQFPLSSTVHNNVVGTFVGGCEISLSRGYMGLERPSDAV